MIELNAVLPLLKKYINVNKNEPITMNIKWH